MKKKRARVLYWVRTWENENENYPNTPVREKKWVGFQQPLIHCMSISDEWTTAVDTSVDASRYKVDGHYIVVLPIFMYEKVLEFIPL